MEKVIDWELCKKLKFDHATKWYMYKPKSVLEDETHKTLCNFEIQMDHQILARKPYLGLIDNKKGTCCSVDFIVLADHRVKINESKKIDKYSDFINELKSYGT